MTPHVSVVIPLRDEDRNVLLLHEELTAAPLGVVHHQIDDTLDRPLRLLEADRAFLPGVLHQGADG